MPSSPGKEKRKPKTAMRDPKLRKLRALRMLEAKITGKTNAELAELFNVCDETVIRTLDYAKRAGLVATFEDSILQKLVPLALTAFANALINGDTEVAKEVLKGTGLLKKQAERASPQASGENESLEIYIRKIRGNPNEQPAPVKPTLLGQLVARPSLPASGAGDVIDGSVTAVDGRPVAEAAAPPVCEGGDEGRPAHAQPGVDLPADPA